MIINKKDNTYQTRSDKPNENWLNDDKYYVLDDDTELAKKIILLYPFIKFKIENGNIVDVIDNINERQKFNEYQNIKIKIERLKKNLSDTDYKAIKYAEGQLLEEEYAPIKAERQNWRDEINELEAKLGLEA